MRTCNLPKYKLDSISVFKQNRRILALYVYHSSRSDVDFISRDLLNDLYGFT